MPADAAPLGSPPLRPSSPPLDNSPPNPDLNRPPISPLVAPHRRPYGRGPAVSAFTLGTMRALGSPAQMQGVLRAALAAGILGGVLWWLLGERLAELLK